MAEPKPPAMTRIITSEFQQQTDDFVTQWRVSNLLAFYVTGNHVPEKITVADFKTTHAIYFTCNSKSISFLFISCVPYSY